MNLMKATRKALKNGQWITRKDWCGILFLEPTDTPDCCVCHNGMSVSCRWNPYARDLSARDWVCVKPVRWILRRERMEKEKKTQEDKLWAFDRLICGLLLNVGVSMLTVMILLRALGLK